MAMPLVVFSALSLFIWFTPNPFNPEAGWVLSSWVKTPELSVPDASRYSFMQKGPVAEPSGEEVEVVKPEMIYSSTYTEAMHHAHIPAMILSLIMALSGIVFAFLFYQ